MRALVLGLWLLGALAGVQGEPLASFDDDLGLPPAAAARPLGGERVMDGMSYREVLRLLASRPMLDVNLVIAPSVRGLDHPAALRLAGMTLGEVMRLCLQLTGTRLARAGPRTFVVTEGTDGREFGAQRSAVVRPLRVLPSRVLEFLQSSPGLRRHLDPDRIHADDRLGGLHLIARPETVAKLEELVRYLDERDQQLWARIPLDHLDEAGLRLALEGLGRERRDRLPDFLVSEGGRMVVARGAPEEVARLQELVRALDRPPGQALVELTLLEVTREGLTRLGMSLGTGAVEAASLEDLLRGDLQPARVAGRLDLLLSRTGGRHLGTRSLVVQDGAPARVEFGQVRTVRTAALSTSPGGPMVTAGVAEVPLGIRLGILARIHDDGTTTLTLDLTEDRALAVGELGLDREGFSLTTQVRAIRDRPTLLTGFSRRSRSRTRRAPAGAERRDQDGELALLVTVGADPAAPPREPATTRVERNPRGR